LANSRSSTSPQRDDVDVRELGELFVVGRAATADADHGDIDRVVGAGGARALAGGFQPGTGHQARGPGAFEKAATVCHFGFLLRQSVGQVGNLPHRLSLFQGVARDMNDSFVELA
jgi:hypothetical protein